MSPRPRKSKSDKPTSAAGEKPTRKAREPFVERRGAIVEALFKTFVNPHDQKAALTELPPRLLTVSDEQAVGAILDNGKLNADEKLDMLRTLFKFDWETYNRKR